MVWVAREYAGPLAVLLTWLTAVLPWNISVSTLGGQGRLIFIRFPFVEVQYTAGIAEGIDGLAIRTVISAIELQSGQGLETATLIWGVSAVVVLATLVVSVGYYVDEKRVEAGPVDPVRLIGGLLGVAAVGLGAATVAVWTGGFGGLQFPVGVVLIGLFAAILLRAEKTE